MLIATKMLQHAFFACTILVAISLLPRPLVFAQEKLSNHLTSEEQKWLQHHAGKITFSGSPDFPPIIFTSKQGQPQGLSIDYIRLVEQKLHFHFKFIPSNSWIEVKNRLISGEIDFIPDMIKSNDRLQYANFSNFHFNIPTVIIVKNTFKKDLEIGDLSGMNVAVGNGFRIHEYLKKLDGSYNLYPQPNVKSCLLLVSTGEVDAVVADFGAASHIIEKEGISNLRVAGYVLNNQYHIASRKNMPMLAQILNKGLNAITEEERTDIYRRWIKLEMKPFYKKRHFWFIIFAISLLVSSIILLVLVWNRKLQDEVQKRTVALEEQKETLQNEIISRRKAQKELIRHRNLLESILENIQGFTYRTTCSDSLIISFLTGHIEKLTGYPAEDFINNAVRTYGSVIHPADRQKTIESYANVTRSAQLAELEYRILHKNGQIYWVYEKMVPILDKNGEPKFLDGFVVNITKQKILEKHFSQAQKMEAIGALSGGIAHDFNNILGGILGFAELLREDFQEMECPDKIHRRIENVIEGGMRAKELTAQILAFSRAKSYCTEPVSVAVIVKEVIKLLQSTLPKNIEIQKSLISTRMVSADVTKLYQIIMNICTNAAYAMKEKGGILSIALHDVSFRKTATLQPKNNFSDDFLCITVKDTGHGMDEEIQRKILEPFFTTKPKGEGSGIGLWVVNSTVKEMNGFMEISSTVNKGSQFDVYLPEYRSNRKRTSAVTPHDSRQFTGEESILFVDDEATLTQLAKEFLSPLGYRIDVFNSSTMALLHIKKNPHQYDLVITDLSLPELTGIALAEGIHRINPEIKIILSTGMLDKSRDKKLELFAAILKKPVLIADMAKTIRDVLDTDR